MNFSLNYYYLKKDMINYIESIKNKYTYIIKNIHPNYPFSINYIFYNQSLNYYFHSINHFLLFSLIHLFYLD